MFKEKLPVIGRTLSLILLIGTIAVIITAFIRARMQPRPPGPVRTESTLKGNVTSVVEGYKYVRTEKGRETFRLLAAKEITYEDGKHELEEVDLTAFDEKPGKNLRILSNRGTYLKDQGVVVFEGNVRVTSNDGLEVLTESLKYEQQPEVASTQLPIRFQQGELSGSSVGAQLHARTRNLELLGEVRVVSADPDPKQKGGPPIEIRSEKASYAELDGIVRFEGHANVVQGQRSARADVISGVLDLETRKPVRIEMRGNSMLKSAEPGKISEMQARDLDFFFDETQQLKQAIASGAARASSLEKDSPREIRAEKIDTLYRPTEKGANLQSVATEGRTIMKIEVTEQTREAKTVTQRIIEADGIRASYREDGKNLARAEAAGNAILTVTPILIRPDSERKRLRAAECTVDFFEKGNAIKTFVATGKAVVEFEPLHKESGRTKKTLGGNKLTANFDHQTQDLTDLVADGDARLIDGDRHATAARALYSASAQIVTMRGKPQLWDSSSRANADEIDANLESGESFLRGRVRSTYYSRESTGGAAPFKNQKAPVTIAADQATVKHRESAARYAGNVRAWQEDDFVRAENLELDKGERVMTAWGNAQSAFYDFERETAKKRRELVPVFASAERITYRENTRTAYYENGVKIRQGADQIDSKKAEARMDDQNRLVRMEADGNVVLTQPARRATGDGMIYTVADDTAVLTGNPAVVEDREREAVTKSAKLTLHLADARIQASDDSGTKKRVRTTHRIQN